MLAAALVVLVAVICNSLGVSFSVPKPNLSSLATPTPTILPKEPVDVKEPETSVVSTVVDVKVVTSKAVDSTRPKEPVPSVLNPPLAETFKSSAVLPDTMTYFQFGSYIISFWLGKLLIPLP